VLVAHAYGGAVVGAIHEARVKSFVYIAALAPDEGETVAQVFYRNESHPEAPKLAPDKHDFIWMPEDGFSRAVAHKASTDRTKILAAVQRPISVHCIHENAPAPGWKSKPSWFLLAEEDRMINPKTQRFMAGRMGAKIRSGRVDHSPMYSAPDLVIDVISEAASLTLGDGTLPGRAVTG
jgi:pimeloyl-ACP methyl ester carboxylesterase